MNKKVIGFAAGIFLICGFCQAQAAKSDGGEKFVIKQKFPAGTYKITEKTQIKQDAVRENNKKDGMSSTYLYIATVRFSARDESGNQTIHYRMNKKKHSVNFGTKEHSINTIVDTDELKKKNIKDNQLGVLVLLFNNTAIFKCKSDGSLEYISGLDEAIEKNVAWKDTKQKVINELTAFVTANIPNMEKYLPDKPVKVGDTWVKTENSPVPVGSKGTCTSVYNCKLGNVESTHDGKIAIVEFLHKGCRDVTQERPDGDKGIDKKDVEENGTVRINITTGQLIGFISNYKSDSFLKDISYTSCLGGKCKPFAYKGSAAFHTTCTRELTVEKISAAETASKLPSQPEVRK